MTKGKGCTCTASSALADTAVTKEKNKKKRGSCASTVALCSLTVADKGGEISLESRSIKFAQD